MEYRVFATHEGFFLLAGKLLDPAFGAIGLLAGRTLVQEDHPYRKPGSGVPARPAGLVLRQACFRITGVTRVVGSV